MRSLLCALAGTLMLTACTATTSGDPTPSPSPAAAAPTSQASPAPTPSPTPSPLPQLRGLDLELVADGFTDPILAVSPRGDDRIFVVERRGVIRIIAADGTVLDEPFLDLRSVVHANSIEQGLLGLAFHPDHQANGRLFVYHSLASNDNQLVEYAVSENENVGDPTSARVMRVFDKEPDKVRHNAGNLLFGPDGHLWVSVGDAARASVNGQDPTTPFGAIHRYDVDSSTDQPWTPAPDNPFVDGQQGDPAVWAYGLRNPWRFSIDVESEAVWIGDVGQETWEEVNRVPLDGGGSNLGWPAREGTDPFYGGDPGGPTTTLTEPVHVVRHDEAEGGCSITGGWVYRGAAIPELDGHYFFADWCLGWIRSFDTTSNPIEVTDHSEELDVRMPSSFGIDPEGELLIVDYAAGAVHRLVDVR